MPKFIFTYHGGEHPNKPEDGQKMMQDWKDWAESLGSVLINPGTPVGTTKILTKDGVSDEPPINPISGFSIIEADSMEFALELLKKCPHIHLIGGTLEVSEMMHMGDC
tara:strand:+ start:7948 stop:8271 length:324 start_codon:yes stop_codon:yes gene_type:complete